MRNFIYALLMLSSVFSLGQNGTFKGMIVDHRKKAVEFASITIEGNKTKTGTSSNKNGYFEISLSPGQYTVTLQALGFSSENIEITITPHKTTQKTFTLKENIFGLKQVIISGEKKEIPTYSRAGIIHKIDSKLLQLSPTMSLSESLNFSPGLRMEDNCQSCGFSQLRINGLDGKYSQIMINGKPIFSSLMSIYGLEMIPANMIDRIEVSNNGSLSQYIGNAIGGSVNIVTKNPIENQFQIGSNYALIHANTPDVTLFTNASIVDEKLNKGVSFFAYNRNRNHFDANGDTFSEIPLLNNTSFGTHFFLNTSDRSKLNLNINSINENRRGGNKFDLQPHQADIAESIQHKILGGDVSFEIFSDDFTHKVEFFASAQNTHRNSYYGNGGFIADSINNINDISIKNQTFKISQIKEEVQNINNEEKIKEWLLGKFPDITPFEQENFIEEIEKKSNFFTALNSYGKSYDLSSIIGAQYHYQINPISNLHIGSEYMYNHIEDFTMAHNRKIDQRIKTLGSFFQFELKLSPLTIIAGARYDISQLKGLYTFANSKKTTNNTFKNLIPLLSAKYDITPSWKIRASYSQGYRTPQAFDEDLHIESVGGKMIFVNIDPSLKSEKSNNISASINYTTQNMGSSQANVVFEFFYNQIQNSFELIRNDNENIWENQKVITKNKINTPGITSVKGFHLEANYSYINKYIFQMGATVQKSKYEYAQNIFLSENKSVNTNKILRTPDIYGFLNLTYNPVSNINITLSNILTGSMDVFHESAEQIIHTPTFVETNIKASYKFIFLENTYAELSLGVQNIFNSYQKDFDKGIDRDSNYIYGPSKPITFFMGFKIGM